MSGKYESTPLPIKQTTNRMRATIDYIKRKFDEYNEMCFDGKLKPLPIKLSNAKSFLGAVCFRREKNANGTWHYYGFVFKISTVMDLPEEEVEDTILHEMIHYYIMSNQMQDTAPHGKLFIAKMKEINVKFNRKLSVSHRSTKEQLDSDLRRRQHLICVSRLKNGRRAITIATRTRLFDLWDTMPRIPNMAEWRWVVSTDPFFNRFPRATKPIIYYVPAEELEEHLKDALPLVRDGNTIRVKR